MEARFAASTNTPEAASNFYGHRVDELPEVEVEVLPPGSPPPFVQPIDTNEAPTIRTVPQAPQPTTPPRLIFPGRPAQTSSVFLIVIVTVVVTVAVLGICAVVAYCFCLRAKQVADGELPSSKADSRVSQGSVVAGNGNGSRQRTSQPSKGDMASKADPSRRASIALPAMPESDRASLRESQRRSTSQVSRGSDVVYKAEL